MKRLLRITAAVVSVAALGTGWKGVHAAGQSASNTAASRDWQHHDGDDDDARIRRGFEIAPVPLSYDRDNRERHEQVGLGSYLVNAVGGCNDCHTQPSYAPGHNPFMGQPKQVPVANYLAGGQPFGPFISRNLTPENGLPAGRTYKQFLKEMRTGADLDHPGQLLQVMPWPDFQDMSDHDLRAIYEYLKAIPAATPGAPTPASAAAAK